MSEGLARMFPRDPRGSGDGGKNAEEARIEGSGPMLTRVSLRVKGDYGLQSSSDLRKLSVSTFITFWVFFEDQALLNHN